MFNMQKSEDLDFSEHIVVLSLCVCLAGFYPLWRFHQVLNQIHTALPHVAGTLLVICAGCILYGRFAAPWKVKVQRYDIPLGKDNNHLGVRIAFLSDFHLGQHKRDAFLLSLVAMTNQEKPDVVLLGGDYLRRCRGDTDHLWPLGNFTAPGGVFAVFGNHDWFCDDLRGKTKVSVARLHVNNRCRRALEKAGVKILANANTAIHLHNATLSLGGMDDIWSCQGNLSRTIHNMPEGDVRILLSHNAEVVELLSRFPEANFDLILSGHVHGGQVRLPMVNALLPLSHHSTRFLHGHYKLNGFHVVATSGTGETGPKVRFRCPPEIVIIDI